MDKLRALDASHPKFYRDVAVRRRLSEIEAKRYVVYNVDVLIAHFHAHFHERVVEPRVTGRVYSTWVSLGRIYGPLPIARNSRQICFVAVIR